MAGNAVLGKASKINEVTVMEIMDFDSFLMPDGILLLFILAALNKAQKKRPLLMKGETPSEQSHVRLPCPGNWTSFGFVD